MLKFLEKINNKLFNNTEGSITNSRYQNLFYSLHRNILNITNENVLFFSQKLNFYRFFNTSILEKVVNFRY